MKRLIVGFLVGAGVLVILVVEWAREVFDAITRRQR